MSDIQGLRAQLRDNRSIAAPRPTVTASGNGGGLLFWIIAAAAGAIAFAVVLLGPRFFTTQRTASLPAFQERIAETAAPVPLPVAAPAAPAQPAPVQAAPAQPPAPVQAVAPQAQPAPAQAAPLAQQSRYANKTPEDIVRTADAVCEQRSQSVRMGGQPQRPAPRAASAKQGPDEGGGGGHKITAADEKLHCFLTEAVSRFCAPNQKRKAAADAINYFKGIEYSNAAAKMAAKVQGTAAVLTPAEIDPGVVDALEALIRGGYLTKAQRDEIGASTPRDVKERLARIVPNVAPCPKPPWWAQFF